MPGAEKCSNGLEIHPVFPSPERKTVRACKAQQWKVEPTVRRCNEREAFCLKLSVEVRFALPDWKRGEEFIGQSTTLNSCADAKAARPRNSEQCLTGNLHGDVIAGRDDINKETLIL